jgi:transcriptional regulator with PAS, ATPase and Fis domain
MSDEQTSTMAGDRPRSSDARATPGLVLAYAPDLAAAPEVVLLPQGSVVIGRETTPGGVAIALSSVSRLHARVQRKADKCSVHDVGSRNGVLVRGEKIESADLDDRDDVRIGDAVFVFVADGADVFVGTRASGEGETPLHGVISAGPATRRALGDLAAIARADLTVLVHGETGTGKELVAQAVHTASGRKGALSVVNCAAIPAELVESELFGYRRGAFTGADRDSPGLVRSAHGGTLFLDEIGDLPLDIQPKLLRLLESKEIAPVGSAKTERVDVRVVCATHADLAALVEKKKFRADLYSRIKGYVLTLPPLRRRKEDMLRLVRVQLARLERADAEVSVGFMVALLRHDWPFNVRELFSVIHRAVALAPPGTTLDVEHLPEEIASPPARGEEKESADKPPVPDADALRAALAQHGGNIAALARFYKRDRSLIHRWLKHHGIKPVRED